MANVELFNPKDAAAPLGRYSHGAFVKAGSDLLFIAGQVGVRPDGVLPPTAPEQAEQVYRNTLATLREKGMGPEHLVKMNIYVVAGQALDALRAARAKVLGDIAPTSTLIYVPQLVEPKYLIEVEAVAAR